MTKNKKIILIVIAIILLAGGIYWSFLRKKEPGLNLTEARRGNVVQEVSETGTVKKGQELNLSFKTSGKIEKIWVEIGERIKEGDILAKLDATELKIQLNEAQANFDLAQAKLNKLLAGASQEEIQIAQTEVSNAQISLEVARENLSNAYQDALNILDDSYLKIYNSLSFVNFLQRTYFFISDQDGIEIKENKEKIEQEMFRVKTYLDAAKENPEDGKVEVALSEMEISLEKISQALNNIREICEESIHSVSPTDKTSLDTQRTNVITAITNVTNHQQTISSMKLSIETAEGQLKMAKDKLSLTTAKPRQEDIDSYQAQVKQAEAQVNLLKIRIEETILKSPVAGQIIKINKEIGEIVQSMLSESVIVILPDNPFEIETDIYEEDVAKIQIANPVDISLIAFPDKIFKGKVIFIDPIQKLIEGVVYYKVVIIFQDPPEGVKPGMTADIVIKTTSKENVLIIPEDAIQKKDKKIMVQVWKNGLTEEREIEIGIQGDDVVEVISGLNEGEKIIRP